MNYRCGYGDMLGLKMWTPCNMQEPPEQGEQIKSILITMEDDNGYRWVTNVLNKLAVKNSKIVAWMPMPEPYKEGTEE